ncbi:MAG: hypothetical protein HFI31_00860 [Lachnospiraceae bacterium]|nr:hypothetical protein [Lachnospiraceae bacterium]
MSCGGTLELLEEYDEKKVRRYLRKEAREEGRKEGIAQGINTGMERKLVDLICRKLRKGKGVKAIAEELEEEPEAIERICQAAQEFAPDYDSELIAEKLLGE